MKMNELLEITLTLKLGTSHFPIISVINDWFAIINTSH